MTTAPPTSKDFPGSSAPGASGLGALAAAGAAVELLTSHAAEAVPVGDLPVRAAVHVFNRLGYGPRPGDVGLVLSKPGGLDRYLDEQLDPGPDAALDKRMELFPYLNWTMAETWAFYQIDQATRADNDPNNNTNYISTLGQQFRSAQIVRAAHSRNQLLESMTWFWFNHFNVNIADDYVTYSIHDYEKELRKNALGKFRDVLRASAHHPAMMSYLDNYLSTVSKYDRNGKLTSGLNENYGRELMELHTLGVDAGYTQEHVYNAAIVLTGWGFNRAQGRFTFTAANHDPRATEVFGYRVPAGQMQESGEALLDYLSRHEKTAEFISRKLVRYFVADDPPADLVRRAASTYMKTDGDIPSILRTIFESSEFWAEALAPARYKDPFQYVVSTLRAVDADVQDARSLTAVLANMGQPQYNCIPPTGWTLKSREWVNASSQLFRMNFALDLMSNVTSGNANMPFQGINVDVVRVLGNHNISAKPEDVAAFFNREVLGNRMSPSTLEAVRSLGTSGPVSLINRVTGLLLAGPEAQGR
jgi:uncharacterized protein (DUF1800 family)